MTKSRVYVRLHNVHGCLYRIDIRLARDKRVYARVFMCVNGWKMGIKKGIQAKWPDTK